LKDRFRDRILLKRLGWFVLLWMAGVLAVMTLAWLIRTVMTAI